MKISNFFLVLVIVLPFFAACQDDITELSDPRDAICTSYRVEDSGNQVWDAELIKSTEDKQTIYIWNLHGIDGDATVGQIPTNQMFLGKLAAGTNESVLTLEQMTLVKNDENVKILEGKATIDASDITRFSLTYKIQFGNDPAETFTANFGPHQINPNKKRKAKAKKELQ